MVSINHYLDVLKKLQSEKEWDTLYIHPPAPVIDVTRDIVRLLFKDTHPKRLYIKSIQVKKFNAILKKRVQETPGILPDLYHEVFCLDGDT